MKLIEFKYLLKVLSYFIKHFPRRLLIAMFFAIVLSILELFSISMILPLISLGGDIGSDAKILNAIKSFFSYLNLEYSFWLYYSHLQ